MDVDSADATARSLQFTLSTVLWWDLVAPWTPVEVGVESVTGRRSLTRRASATGDSPERAASEGAQHQQRQTSRPNLR